MDVDKPDDWNGQPGQLPVWLVAVMVPFVIALFVAAIPAAVVALGIFDNLLYVAYKWVTGF